MQCAESGGGLSCLDIVVAVEIKMLNLDIKWLDEPRCGLQWQWVAGTRKGGLSSSSLGANLSNVGPSAGLQHPLISRAIANYLSRSKSEVQKISRSSTNPPPPQSSACDWLNPAPREAQQQVPSRATEISAFWWVLLTTPRSISSQSTSAIAPRQ
jgi:hypothetical protein